MKTRTPRDLSDRYCPTWKDCVNLYGDPLSTEVEITPEKGNKKITFEQIGKTRGGKAGLKSFDDPEVVEMLNNPNFDPIRFIKETKFSEECSSHLQTHIKNSKEVIDDFNKSPIQKIADNLHHYINATESLMDNSFPYESDLRNLSEQINTIVQNMTAFFNGIKLENQRASEASKELRDIGSSNAFLFTLATDIERLRSMGQFDEIISVYEKKQNLPKLEKNYLFTLALLNVEKALRGVEDSLKNKILQMTKKTFNEKYCSLLMGIKPNSNPLIDIFNSFDHKARKTFKESDNLTESCSEFKKLYPLLKTLYDFLRDNYINKFNQDKSDIEKLIKGMVEFISKTTIDVLIKEANCKTTNDGLPKDGKSKDISVFNNKLHEDVASVTKMWKDLMETDFIKDSLERARLDTCEWYMSFIKTNFKDILQKEDNGLSLVDHVLKILDGDALFTPEVYKSLLSEPFFELLDGIHENLIVNDKRSVTDKDDDLVKTIEMLLTLTRDKKSILINKYEMCVNVPFDEDIKNEITEAAETLTALLKDKLIYKISININSKINHSVFMNCIDWQAKDLPISVDGWLVYALNKVIECKCEWGELYNLYREDLIAVIVNSVYYAVNEMPTITKRARMRWCLNLAILEETLYMNKLKPIIDPDDPSQQRTIDPPCGVLGKHPELCYVPIEKALGISSGEIKAVRSWPEYAEAKSELNMQISALQM